MPLVSGLLRRRVASIEQHLRQHSSNSSDSIINQGAGSDGRSREQLPSRSDFRPLVPAPQVESAIRRSTEKCFQSDTLSPHGQKEGNKHGRFSKNKSRYASESQLSTKARLQAQPKAAPHMSQPLETIATAPTNRVRRPRKKSSRLKLPGRKSTSAADDPPEQEIAEAVGAMSIKKRERRNTMSEGTSSSTKSRVTFDEPRRPATQQTAQTGPPPYGDEATSTLALPINRLSESSRSDASSGDHRVYATTTTTTHTVHTTTTLFRLPLRRKPSPFFDLAHLPQKSNQASVRHLAPSLTLTNCSQTSGAMSPAMRSLHSPSCDDLNISSGVSSPLPSPSRLAKTSGSPVKSAMPLLRKGSTASRNSLTQSRFEARGRSSTLNSVRNISLEDPIPTPPPQSTRTSSSTGRKSFGDIFSLSHRLRQNSEPSFPRTGSGFATPGSNNSKNNSVQLAREPVIVLPERHEDDTPAKYLVRLEEVVSRGVVASVLSKGADPFSQAVLRSYMRGFGFFGDPMDMAIRKLLMEVELPKETQQIDRCLQGFANRYHECNPGIYASPDQAYFIAFSLLILHTDVFNKNNKHKMQKPDYLKNTRGEGIFDEILECFYDNISYTPFIHVEDDLDINGERIIPYKMKKKSIFSGNVDPAKRPSKEPVDPYTLIIDSKLDTLRPNLKEVMHVEEHYSYLGTAGSLNLSDLQKTFFKTGVLQIVSARSRPDAFMSDKTVNNPDEAQAGIVDIKITKVGLLWRKDHKKKKTRSPWQEWGAILTGAQLYFFKNTAWIKNLINQLEIHIKQGHDGTPVIFKPPLDQFKPDALMSTDDSVALLDSAYKKHKNAFVFVRHGGFEETFLADNEDEMNDWLAKLNYAAAFRTSGVRMRGVVGGNYDGQRARGIRRLDSHKESIHSIQTTSAETNGGKIDTKMAHDILSARREIMLQKIADAEEKLSAAQKQLDAQLRNARHLQILAPIQQKTRDNILLAAGKISAQLKWGRMEIWRLRCHKDILSMDLEEERRPHTPTSKNIETPNLDQAALPRLHSKASSLTTQRISRSPTSQSVNRLSLSGQQTPQIERDLSTDNIFQTPPTLMTVSSYNKAQASWELPNLKFDTSSPGKASTSSAITSSSPALPATPSKSTLKSIISGDSQCSPPLNIDAAERAILEQAGLIVDSEKSPDLNHPATGPETEEMKDPVHEKDKLERGKIRRSLHRTLRDAHVPTHTRSRKGKDSSSSIAMAEENRDDVLSRGTGSFVVHGKKASVITFGPEFQSMTPDERLRLRRNPCRDSETLHSPATIDDDFHSVFAEPYEFHERHESTATTSTATARSFRDLHTKFAVHSKNGVGLGISDGDDHESAVSFSDGWRTPMSPVENWGKDSEIADKQQASENMPQLSLTQLTAIFSKDENFVGQQDNQDDDVNSQQSDFERLPDHSSETRVSA